jgi:EAL domain-containing protein (putative c-di-GMP-specific phosphodiesterase class I)
MLGENLGIEVVAEGVENKEQLDHLLRLGCHYGQGYLFSRPVSASEARAMIRKGYAKTDDTPFMLPPDSSPIFEAPQVH